MNPDQFGGLIRNLLIPLAAAAAAHGLAANTWDGIVGLVVCAATFGYGAWQHDATQDMLLSLIRSAIAAAGGYMAQRGWVTSDQVTIYASAAAIIVPNIWTWFVHAAPGAATPPKKAIVALIGTGVAGKIALVLIAAAGLAACNASNVMTDAQIALGVAETVDPALLAKADKTIAQVSNNDLGKACGVFDQAVGYYSALKPLIPTKYTAKGDPFVGAGVSLCAAPPTDTATALAALNKLWVGVQAATRAKA